MPETLTPVRLLKRYIGDFLVERSDSCNKLTCCGSARKIPGDWKFLEKEVGLTFLRLHLCDFLEPVPPHLTITWLVGLAEAFPADTRVINRAEHRETSTKPACYFKIQQKEGIKCLLLAFLTALIQILWTLCVYPCLYNNKSWCLPAEQVTLATVDSWGWQQGEAVGVAVSRARSGEPHRSLTASRGTPADGWVVFHEGLQYTMHERLKKQR